MLTSQLWATPLTQSENESAEKLDARVWSRRGVRWMNALDLYGAFTPRQEQEQEKRERKRARQVFSFIFTPTKGKRSLAEIHSTCT